jgi:hypothetical protein
MAILNFILIFYLDISLIDKTKGTNGLVKQYQVCFICKIPESNPWRET